MDASQTSSTIVAVVAAAAAIVVIPGDSPRGRAARVLLLAGLGLALVLLVPLSPWRRAWLAVALFGVIAAVLVARAVWERQQNAPPRGIELLRVDEPQDGQLVPAFSSSQTPLTARGVLFGKTPAAIRVVLADRQHRFYLQHPEVELANDLTWQATNIRPEQGIDSLNFVALGKRGKAHFDRMVEDNQWGSFRELPANSKLLTSVKIEVT